MATEIEHKYLVTSNQYIAGAASKIYICQGYLSTSIGCVVRVRITDDKAFLTIKGANRGASRAEYEIEIDTEMAQSMLKNLSQSPIIEKTRYLYPYKNHTWEIDHFHGENEGLVIAEIELSDENEAYEKPSFIGDNVTGMARYYNSNIAQHPYSRWSDEEKSERL